MSRHSETGTEHVVSLSTPTLTTIHNDGTDL